MDTTPPQGLADPELGAVSRFVPGRLVGLSPVVRYGVAVATTVAAVLSRVALNPAWGLEVRFLPFYAAVMVSAWVGGFWPGVVTTLVSAAAVDYFWMPPLFSPLLSNAGDMVALGSFVVVGGIVSGLNEVWRRGTVAMSRSEERLRVTLASIGDGVITTDQEGRVSLLNGVAQGLTGWTQQEAAGRPLEDVFVIVNESSRRPVENPTHRVLREGVVIDLRNHTILLSKDGREIPVDDSAAPIRAADGVVIGVVIVFRDATEQRRGERERAALLQLEHTARAHLEHVAEELHHLQALTDTALANLDRKSLLPELLSRIRTAVASDTATIWLLDPDGQHLRPVASDGLREEIGEDIRIPIGGGVAGRIAESDQAIVIHDLSEIEVLSPFLRGRVRSVVGAPLKVGDRLIGVIYVGMATPHRFTDADVRLVSLVSERLAVAIERARLHRAERAARIEAEAAEQRLRFVLQAARMGTWQWTIRTGNVAWSPGLEAIHGFAPGTFPGTFEAFQKNIYPADGDRVLGALTEAVDQRRDHQIEYRIVRSDGTVRWVEGRGQLFTDANGQPDRMVGVCSDITERKHAEERFRLAVEAAPSAMIMTDRHGTIQLINALTEQLLGYGRDEIVGQSIEQLVPSRFRGGHVKDRMNFFMDPRQRPMGGGRDLYALRKDGSEVAVEIGLSPLETADGPFVLAAVTDITERKRAAAQLQQAVEAERTARREAQHANQLKDQFLATVSHELRAPLNAVLGWADMLRTGTLEDTQRQRASEAVFVNAKRQAQLIDDLLDVTRIVSGKMRLERTAVDLHAVVRAALDVTQPAAEAKRIKIQTDVDASIGPIFGDAGRLQQVLWNLLTNAVKFTPEAGAIHLSVRRAESVVEIAVTDTGKGIAADFLPWVFEPFRQADGSATRTHGGLGLGLAIVKHIVEAHGGTVRAESAGEGHGSTLIVRLPVVPVYAEQAEASPSASSASAGQGAGPVRSLEGVTVLVVDDDADSRDLVATCLEGSCASVFTAASAAAAFEVLQRERVDVLLADIAMPGEDGYGLIRKVRALESSLKSAIPAIALTSFTREDDVQRALQAGFQLHLGKPIESRSLVEAVASLAYRTASR